MKYMTGFLIGFILMFCLNIYCAGQAERVIKARDSEVTELRIELAECEADRDRYRGYVVDRWAKENGHAKIR